MKNKKIFGWMALSLAAVLSVSAAVSLSAKKSAEEVKAEAHSYPCSQIIINDESGWCFRTLWLDNFGFASGYSMTEFDSFVADYYENDLSGSWDRQGTTRGYKKYANGYNLCAGGSGGAGTEYTFELPEWVSYCSVEVQNNNETRNVNYLNNFKDTNGTTIGNGYKKSTKIYANSTGGWPSIGSSVTTSNFDTTLTLVIKDEDGVTLETSTTQVSKYDIFDAEYILEGYNFIGWYTDSSLLTSFSGMPLARTTLYAKMQEIVLPQLDTPVLVRDTANNVTWDDVENAQSYAVTDDGVASSYATDDELLVEGKYLPGQHTVTVKAIGDNIDYSDSPVATESYTITSSFYLVGSFQNAGEWDTTHWVNAKRMSENSLKYSATISLSADDEVKAVWLAAGSPDPVGTWTNTGSLVVDPLANIEYPVSKLEGGNIKFDRAGSYTITVEYENAGANLKYTVVANDYVQPVYKLVVGTGVEAVEYSMTLNTNTEFVANNVTLKHGQTVSITKDGSADTGYYAKEVFNNNFDANGRVVANVTGTSVYVDVSAKTIWNGLDLSAGYHMLLNGNRVALTEQSASEWKTEDIDFVNGDVIRFIDVKGSGNVRPVVFDAVEVNPYSEVTTFNYVEGTGMVATANSEAAVYLQLNDHGNAIYFGSVDPQLSRARQFATDFLSDIRGVCDYDGNTDLDDLKTAWQLEVTEFGGMATDYAGAQTILKAAVTTPSSVAEIRDFIELYVLVLDRHGNTQTLGTGYDFLESGISGARYTGAAQIFNETNLPLILIIGVSVLAITSVGAVVYLKVRKHD